MIVLASLFLFRDASISSLRVMKSLNVAVLNVTLRYAGASRCRVEERNPPLDPTMSFFGNRELNESRFRN
jgi:hypothetical protein